MEILLVFVRFISKFKPSKTSLLYVTTSTAYRYIEFISVAVGLNWTDRYSGAGGRLILTGSSQEKTVIVSDNFHNTLSATNVNKLTIANIHFKRDKVYRYTSIIYLWISKFPCWQDEVKRKVISFICTTSFSLDRQYQACDYVSLWR